MDSDITGIMRISTAPVWNDIRFDLVSAKGAGAKIPTYSTFIGGIKAWLFGRDEELQFQVEMPHDWFQGSTVFPHLHYVPKDDQIQGVLRIGLEYTLAGTGDTYSGTTTIARDLTISANSALDYLLEEFDTSGVSMTGKTMDTVWLCRVFRDTNVAGDTYAGDVFFTFVDFHYLTDSRGSRQKLEK